MGTRGEEAVIFFIAGTSDASELGIAPRQKGYRVMAGVVTEHAAKNLQEAGLDVHSGRLDFVKMCDVLTALVQSSS